MWDTLTTTLALLVSKRKFFFQKLVSGYSIPEAPHFDESGLTFFTQRLQNTRVYLEYGSGASTVLAASYASMVISVECDRLFAKTMERHVGELAGKDRVRILYANIGVTEEWAYPLFQSPTPRRMAAWRNYI